MYDEENVFAKILEKKISANVIFEDDWAVAFYDIAPKAPVHILVIPKGKYVDFQDFALNASDEELVGYMRAVAKVTKKLELLEKGGFNLIMNVGKGAGQEVFHFHTHILAGMPLWERIAVNNPSEG